MRSRHTNPKHAHSSIPPPLSASSVLHVTRIIFLNHVGRMDGQKASIQREPLQTLLQDSYREIRWQSLPDLFALKWEREFFDLDKVVEEVNV